MTEQSPEDQEKKRKEDIIFNHSPEGLKKALEVELEKAKDDQEFLKNKIEKIEISIAKLS